MLVDFEIVGVNSSKRMFLPSVVGVITRSRLDEQRDPEVF